MRYASRIRFLTRTSYRNDNDGIFSSLSFGEGQGEAITLSALETPVNSRDHPHQQLVRRKSNYL
ncbi:hypothetical protein SAMN05428975_3928 [Mucilaginibacter sp. OK268]|nr:hypothetical protein SAMN05428975_3928 [Mucilaginibacter sp. OK268]